AISYPTLRKKLSKNPDQTQTNRVNPPRGLPDPKPVDFTSKPIYRSCHNCRFEENLRPAIPHQKPDEVLKQDFGRILLLRHREAGGRFCLSAESSSAERIRCNP